VFSSGACKSKCQHKATCKDCDADSVASKCGGECEVDENDDCVVKDVDCVMGDWSEWSPCVASEHSRTRQREADARGDGSPCTMASVACEEGWEKDLDFVPGATDEGGADQGGGKYPILPFTGEISYSCFTGCQKYFGGPLKPPYEISPVKVYLAYFSPPERRRGGEPVRREHG
jgi:hypothetical protein